MSSPCENIEVKGNADVDLPQPCDSESLIQKPIQSESDLRNLRITDEPREEANCTCSFKNGPGHSSERPQPEESTSESHPIYDQADANLHETGCPLNKVDSEFQHPIEGGDSESEEFHDAEPILLDDFVDEEALRKEEENLSEEDFVVRLEKAKTYKKEGNDEFGRTNYRDSILTYTKGLLICPLRDKEFRSILYANRSAAKIKMGRNELAIDDCTKSLENNPDYVRVLLRRAKLLEEAEKLDEALVDFQKVYDLDPSIREAWGAIQRLPGQINERNEKLKTEMLGKLKDLGNMILRPFGLSTDNFNLQQDPNSGSYSVNFSNSK